MVVFLAVNTRRLIRLCSEGLCKSQAQTINFRKFLSVYLSMFTLVLKLISCALIFLTLLLNKNFYYAYTIINAFLVYAYKIYSRSVSPCSFKFVAFVSLFFILTNDSW